ncbi:hypothetical protein SAMN05446635_8081 [Burkholderia sp. OK233]|nr:hypothetical protein SAMN05446635_8081 [Burkholderia sp. OK233]
MKTNMFRRRVAKSIAIAPMIGGFASLSGVAHAQPQPKSVDLFEKPFSPRSLWNARPLNPVLGNTAIPATINRAYLEHGPFSSRVFEATSSDPAISIAGAQDAHGPWVSDELRHRNVVIPHFPADTKPATGTDGHCEIHDRVSGLIHSLYGMKYDANARMWRAKKYAVVQAGGSGWGSPERPDGPRAAGVSTAGGMLRIHEAELFELSHAIAVAADANVLRSGPMFPATLEDRDGGMRYTGPFAMGTLLMLPRDFDEASLAFPHARAIARTLKTFGARLVDQTVGTFAFYGEIGSAWSQSRNGTGAWNGGWETDLTRIRDALRPVMSVEGWLDANGARFAPTAWSDMNLLSMRGPWTFANGTGRPDCEFDTASGLLMLPACDQPLLCRKLLYLRDDASPAGWFKWQDAMRWYTNPQAGSVYRIIASGTGECEASFEIRTGDGAQRLGATRSLRPSETDLISIPRDGAPLCVVHVLKHPGPAAAIRLEVLKA